ncbi:MAG: four-helix bundle copper-binding protein [Bacteroidota bacterium]
MNNNTNSILLNALHVCADACNFCTTACLGEPDVKMMTACIRLDMDCAAICSLTAQFIARKSIHGKHLLKECAELCGLCAAECEKHEHMQHCKDCAHACRVAEKACKATT